MATLAGRRSGLERGPVPNNLEEMVMSFVARIVQAVTGREGRDDGGHPLPQSETHRTQSEEKYDPTARRSQDMPVMPPEVEARRQRQPAPGQEHIPQD